jgi:hypothetical protein
MFDFDTKRKNIKTLGYLITPPRTNQIASYFDAFSITYTTLQQRQKSKRKFMYVAMKV